jgi:hypothetical protein
MLPVMIGEDRLVLPIRYSEYLADPLGNVCVRPIVRVGSRDVLQLEALHYPLPGSMRYHDAAPEAIH